MKFQGNYEKLTKKEIIVLKKILQTHGALKHAAHITALNVNTIKRAKDGLSIKPENATLIRHLIIN